MHLDIWHQHTNISLNFVSLFCICSCDTRYVGDYCEHRNPCLTGHGRCQNGGTCQVAFRNGRPGISCLCPLGFEESLCEIAVANACDQARCYNGGTCQLKTLQDYSCICANGYTGKLQTHTHTHTENKLERPLIKFTNRFSFIIHRRSLPDTESMRQLTMPQRGHLLRSSGKQQIQLQLPARLHRSHLFRGCRRVPIESLPVWRHLCQHAWLLSVSRNRYPNRNRILSRVAYQISVKEDE